MRIFLINYCSLTIEDITSFDRLNSEDLVKVFCSKDSECMMKTGLTFLRNYEQIEFIIVEDATSEKINFRIALYSGMLVNDPTISEIIIVSKDNEMGSTSVYYDKIKLVYSLDDGFNQKFVVPCSKKRVLTANERSAYHKELNTVLKDAGLSNTIKLSASILELIINTDNLLTFKRDLLSLDYKDGSRLYDCLMKFFVKVKT